MCFYTDLIGTVATYPQLGRSVCLFIHWRPRGRVSGFNPHWIFRIFLNSVLAKYSVQALLLYSLNPKFCTGKRKNCMLISHFASASGGRSPPDLPRIFAPGPHWGLPSSRPSGPVPHHVNPLHCKILGTPMFVLCLKTKHSVILLQSLHQILAPPPLHLTTSKVMVIVWRLRGNIIRTVLYIANVLPLQWAQLTKTVCTAQLGREFVFLCFFRLHDLSSCWCMFCFTLDSWVISLHVLALA